MDSNDSNGLESDDRGSDIGGDGGSHSEKAEELPAWSDDKIDMEGWPEL